MFVELPRIVVAATDGIIALSTHGSAICGQIDMEELGMRITRPPILTRV
jgi:hypothetical protein